VSILVVSCFKKALAFGSRKKFGRSWIRIRIFDPDLDQGGNSYADPDLKHWLQLVLVNINSVAKK
jgi:hypothetical protein